MTDTPPHDPAADATHPITPYVIASHTANTLRQGITTRSHYNALRDALTPMPLHDLERGSAARTVRALITGARYFDNLPLDREWDRQRDGDHHDAEARALVGRLGVAQNHYPASITVPVLAEFTDWCATLLFHPRTHEAVLRHTCDTATRRRFADLTEADVEMQLVKAAKFLQPYAARGVLLEHHPAPHRPGNDALLTSDQYADRLRPLYDPERGVPTCWNTGIGGVPCTERARWDIQYPASSVGLKALACDHHLGPALERWRNDHHGRPDMDLCDADGMPAEIRVRYVPPIPGEHHPDI